MQRGMRRRTDDRAGIPRPPSAPRSLTPREREVAFLVADGLKNPSIARRLKLSPATVATYIQRIQSRLGVSNRDQIAGWVQARVTMQHRDIIPSESASGSAD